ncbi:hypothetical protein CEP45_01995 [Mergibacter septicus]|uniref:hypothetical protein n=1 Tax=Mergibacter septicus TaxID=221402 RepID=UPI001C77CF88|nr:hypothetical protein [Mergibacter septicus]QDJ12686.1 hypothetical protein CEP45_01995 [Mergibacter septicus]
MQKIVKLSSLLITLALTGCTIPTTTSPEPTKTVKAEINTTQQDQAILEIEKTAQELQPFIFNYQGHQYVSYLDDEGPILILDQDTKQKNKIYLQAGKVIAVEYDQQWYLFNQPSQPPIKNSTKVKTYAQKLASRFNYNQADKEIDQIDTGEDAKLNYLCISKLQQVTKTKRVFRYTKNFAESNDRLTANIRLNGKDFYAMDCLIKHNRVTLLSLTKQ